MHKAILTALRISTAMLVTSGYLALAVTPYYPAAIVLVPLLLFLFAPLGERLDRHFAFYRQITFWMSLVFLLLILLSLLMYDLLSSVTALVIYIQAYTVLHRKQIRNYHHLYLMSFFLLLAACVMSPEPAIGLVMALFLVSAVVSLFLLQWHGEMLRDTEAGVPRIVGLGVREAPLTPEARPRFDPGVISAVVVVAILAPLVTAGLFLATPRMQAGILGRSDPLLFRQALSAQTVELARGGRIISDQRPVMRVEFLDEPERRFEGAMFWRITSLNDYRRSHWGRQNVVRETEEDAFVLNPGDRNILRTNRLDAVARKHFGMGRVVRQTIYIDNVPQEGVPCLTLVEKVQCVGSRRGTQLSWDASGDFTVCLLGSPTRWLQYEAWSAVQEFTVDQLRAVPDNYREAISPRAYALLTRHNLEPRTLQLVERIVAGKGTVYDKALAIGAYLNNGGYFYTLDLPELPVDHPIDAFINDTKVGHCELFASALALMLRSLGIPTRVVAGYRGGEWSEGDRAYIVRADMAHLWVEVYFIGLGWVTFDPSPSDSSLGGASRIWLARLIARYSLRAKMAWYQSVIGFDQGVQLETWRDLALGLISLGSGLFEHEVATTRFGSGRLPLFMVLATVIVVGGFSVLLARRRAVRVTPTMLTVDQAQVIRVYKRLRRKMARAGADPRGKTAEELCQELRDATLGDVSPGLEVIEAYNEVRFGAKPLSRDRYSRLCNLVRSLHLSKPKTANPKP